MDNKEAALLTAGTLKDKKARDVVLIDIMGKAVFADYMLVATGSSERQIQALVDYVEDALAKAGISVRGIEGRSSGWVLMDFGDIIVNVFTQEMREKYNIEKVWGDCEFLDLEEDKK